MSSEKPLPRSQILPSQLRLTPHTTYYRSFFLLRTPVTVNGQLAQFDYSSGGELSLSCRYPNLSLFLHSVQASLKEVVKMHGVSHVGDVCCEQVPLFPVSFSSEYNLRKFLLHRDPAQQQLGSLFPNLPTHVKLQLFLVTPDAVVKDARMMEVTLENHSACMAVFKESEMFDYWSLFQAYRTGLKKLPDQAAVTIKDLVSELHDVVSWFQLGIYLDISPSELMKIRADHREKTDDCKTEMLVTWLRQTTQVSWSAVVRALVGIRMRALAQKVAVKYGVPIPSAVESKELQQFPVVRKKMSSLQSQLLDRVQQLHYMVEADEQQLSKITNLLDQATKLRVVSSNHRIHTQHQAAAAFAKVKVLVEKKNEVGRKLQLRQRELRFLEQLHELLRDRVGGEDEEGIELREVLISKDEEVRCLQEQLREAEKEVRCAKEEVHSLREELHRVTMEFVKQSARVQELEREKDKLEDSVNWQRNLVEMLLIQSTAVASSKGDFLKEIKDQLSAVEEESITVAGSEVENLKQTIADKDREVALLTGELQTLQAQLHGVDNCQLERQQEKEEEAIHRWTVETSELKAKLVKLEGEKQEGERQLEAIYRQMEFLKRLVAELREKKCSVLQCHLQQCLATGTGLKLAETGQLAQFEVHLMDTAGDPGTTEQQVTAELKSRVDGSITLAHAAHKNSDTYNVSYQCWTRGQHMLSVRVNDVPVHGSPFIVHVRQAPNLLGKPLRVITGLNGPQMISTTGSGELVVSEYHKISFISRDGHMIRSIDTTSVKSGSNWYKLEPMGIVSDDGCIYVTGAHRLSKFNSGGNLVKSVGGKGVRTGQFFDPQGIALSKDKKLFVCDRKNNRIQVFDTNLKFITFFGKEGRGEGEFRHPVGLSFDPAGDVYVADCYNCRVQVFSQNGTFLRTFGRRGSGPGELSRPEGIHVDHNYVYVVDSGNHCVSVFYTSGVFITSFGKEGSQEGELSLPCGITIDQDGFLYVCDCWNNRVQIF